MAQSSLCPPSVLLAGVQTDSTGELALEHRALGREHQKKRGKKKRISAVWLGGGKGNLLATSSIFCVSVLDAHRQFFWSPNLLLGRRNTNNPIQK